MEIGDCFLLAFSIPLLAILLLKPSFQKTNPLQIHENGYYKAHPHCWWIFAFLKQANLPTLK